MTTMQRPMIPKWPQLVLLSALLTGAMPIAHTQEPSPAAISALLNAKGQGNAAGLDALKANGDIDETLIKRKNQAPQTSDLPQLSGTNQPISIQGFPKNLGAFGSHLFAADRSKYVTPGDLPVPSDYTVGIGDTVEIRLFGKENRVLRLMVQRDGNITIPDIGAVSVAGLTLENMSVMLLERIMKQKIGVEATVSMGPLRSIQVFLTGDVNHPGAVTTDALSTVTNALLFSGGIRQSGSMRRIEVRRQGKVVSRIDLYDSLLKGSDKGEIRLQSGDVIFVPTVGKRAGIDGQVQRPAVYELLNEKSAADLIQLAGGLKPTAHSEQTRLSRINQNWQRSPSIISLGKKEAARIQLQDGDVFDIPGIIDTQTPIDRDLRFKTVTLEGAFAAPGTYTWRQGLQLSEVINSYDQLDLATYRPLAVIDRIDPLTGNRTYLTVNLNEVINRKQSVPLERDDRIFTFTQDEIEFLSSAQVQQVLKGELPNVSPGKGVVIDAKSARADEKDLQLGTVSALDAAGKPGAVRTLPKERSLALAGSATNACRGVIELSHIIANEGTQRFRSAVFAGVYRDDGMQLIKSIPCPQVFDTHPRLLPFLLENAITLRGEVKEPGVLPVPPGMTLDVALRARSGLTRSADSDNIEINKLVAAGQKIEVRREQINANQTTDKILLEPGYIVQVRKRATAQEAGIIRLSGELTHPGAYEIRKGEKLSELLARAGGLSQFAYPEGTVFLRPRIKEEKKQYYAKAADDIVKNALVTLSRQTTTPTPTGGGDAILKIAEQVRSTDPIGRMVVEANPTLLQARPELDPYLEPGDEIYIPRRPSTILVMGEVLNPGAIQFQTGRLAQDYIRAAGGLTQYADEDRVIVVYPNGSAEPIKLSAWNFSPTLLPPGSTLYVTREAVTRTSMDVLMLTLQVVKDLAISAASLSVISK